MPFYALKDREPRVHPEAYVHPLAVLIGDVRIAAGCYIGPGAALRADWGGIRLGAGSNVQENCVIHVRPGDLVTLGTDCHVGHGAIIHGAVVGSRVLVGMGAILFDAVVVDDEATIAAGAVLLEGFRVPRRAIVAGVPAKVVGEASEELLERKRRGTALYQTLPPLYRDHLRELPLGSVLEKGPQMDP
jgi:carbonic anhydrase/acetyltransferase-like protein (isoleucine patch superfamily)